ncbi:MAG TPA: ATP-binding protein, partial [Chitinophagales bacterium]|nr:ATP-binding protein [Chitinophagales bacterium]
MNNQNPINNALRQIEQNLRYPESWQNCETHFVELKDLSSGSQWKSLNETVCAFLNTEGGYVICGIRETEKRYVISGFDSNNEDNLIKLRTDFFKNDQNILLDLSDNIFFSYHTIEDIQEKDPNKKTKTIAVIEVLPLGEDQKYVKFKETYFER